MLQWNVTNDTNDKITVTAGQNIGMMATGAGTVTNKRWCNSGLLMAL